MPVPDLKETGKRIHVIDVALVRLLAKRMRLAQDVGVWKQLNTDPIFRSQVEDRRIDVVRSIAAEEGLNPHFAAQLLYNIIGESCKVQMAQTQGGDTRHLDLEQSALRDDTLLANLIDLTAAVAEHYGEDSGGDDHPATAMYLRFEDEHIMQQVARLEALDGWDKSTSIALDLGCGAGRVSNMLVPHFGAVIGYDVSQHMTAAASNKLDAANVSFEQHDLREGIPQANSSVDLVVAGLGTASDIPETQAFVDEVKRVLKPNGRFVLSFYNREALIYVPGFVSIDPSLKAEINVDEDWLMVYVPGEVMLDSDGTPPVHVQGKYYPVYARAYTWGEVDTMVSSMRQTVQESFPVTACVIPRTTLEQSAALLERVEQHDRSLTKATTGAYWLVCGTRDRPEGRWT